jgi:hypothetical protein
MHDEWNPLNTAGAGVALRLLPARQSTLPAGSIDPPSSVMRASRVAATSGPRGGRSSHGAARSLCYGGQPGSHPG